MVLRDYQLKIKEELYAIWNAGCRSVMCQMPTGTGKTVVLSQIISDAFTNQAEEHKEGLQKGVKVLVVAHRKEILEQIKDTLSRYGLGDRLKDGSIVVESIQKLSKSLKADGQASLMVDSPSLVVIDEAHHCTAKTYRMLWEVFPKAKFLGMTATPCRLKQEGFTQLFDKLLCSEPIAKFIHDGWLANYEFISIRTDSETRQMIQGLKKRAVDGDYQTKDMEDVLGTRASIEQLYHSYKEFADGKKGIIYAINREHALKIVDFYRENGESIVMVDGKTPMKERQEILSDYKEGKIKLLCNIEVYGEGLDVKDVKMIQLARPTLSLNKYLQQVGRGLRPNKDGEQTIILDNVGMYYHFGLPHYNRDWERMFRYGQMDDVQEMKQRISNQYDKERMQGNHNEKDVTDGHNLEMMTITNASEVQEALDLKYSKTEVFEYKGELGLRRGKTVVLIPMHKKIGPFVGGYAMVDGTFFVSEFGDTYTNFFRKPCKLLEGGFVHIIGYDYYDLVYANPYNVQPEEVIMFEGFIPLVRIGDLYFLRKHSKEIAFRKEDLWIKGNGFQRKNALNPNQSIYMNRMTGDKVFVFAGYYPDGVKKVREYENGIYYRVEKGGVPVWDGKPGVPIDDYEYRINERNMAEEKAYKESLRMKRIKRKE